MREIRLRAWDKISKRWANALHAVPEETFGMGDLITIELNQSHRYVFVQFTTLHDKNGREIWEGDIVQYWRGGREQTSKVVWSPNEWKNLPDAGFWPLMEYHNYRATDIEVIGNIYENPELEKV